MQSLSWETDVRLFVYQHFVSSCRSPSILETAQSLGVGAGQVREAFSSLAKQQVLVLQPGSGEIRMAMPFSARPTAFRVISGESSWWAN
jgi:hypothetical protein